MNRFCKTCNIVTDGNNYLKDRTVCKNYYKKSEEKTTKLPSSEINNQKLITSTLTTRIEHFWWNHLFQVKLI